jgi:hypothetical protein
MQIRLLIGLTACVAVLGLPLLAPAQAQITEQTVPMGQPTPGSSNPTAAPTASARTRFEGRGIAQGSTFNRGRNANVSLTVERGNFVLNIAEPPGNRARVQYRGTATRQNSSTANPNSFTIDGRVQTFESSASTRILNNTTGTCRIEVFDARVISSSCRTVSNDSNTQFLGLEQF